MQNTSKSDFGTPLKLLAGVGVLYYVLFAGIGISLERDITDLSQSAASEADPTLQVAQD